MDITILYTKNLTGQTGLNDVVCNPSVVSCVYPDLVLRAIKHIFLDILILPLGNLLRRTYR
jgi:hypothetical protein